MCGTRITVQKSLRLACYAKIWAETCYHTLPQSCSGTLFCIKNKRPRKGCKQTLRQACSREKLVSAMCVQKFCDSRGLAIRITYRISLRSSSLWEPRHPLLKVVKLFQGSRALNPYLFLSYFLAIIVSVWGNQSCFTNN